MRILNVTLTCLTICLLVLSFVWAETGTEFSGTVLMVDQSAGKFAVKKESGGTRFTFTANDKTKFIGTGLSGLKDLKKDDRVVVLYQVQGPLYLALNVTKQK